MTITGNKSDGSVDTTQLDVSTYKKRNPESTVLRFKVNLALPRKIGDFEIYQSYVSHIVVNCATVSLFHEDQLRYRDPLWEGPAVAESFPQPKPMAFGGLTKDPRGKILSMVCQRKPGPQTSF